MIVSIVTVCLNEVDRIESTILSILNQTYKDIELIVIDGSSTDGTCEVLGKYKNDIHILISEADNGIYDAMNKGINLSSGEYVQFMNGGDKYYCDTVLDDLMKNGDLSDIIYGDAAYEDASGNLSIYKHPKNITRKFLAFSAVNHQSILFRRELFSKYGQFDLKYMITADYEFLLRLLDSKAVTTSYIPETVARWNMEGISFSKSYQCRKSDEKKEIQKRYMPGYFRFLLSVRNYSYMGLV